MVATAKSRRATCRALQISPTKSKYQDAIFFVIFDFYHNFEGWIQCYGFTLFISSKPHFSGMWFDTRFKNAIRFRYPFSIWKIV